MARVVVSIITTVSLVMVVIFGVINGIGWETKQAWDVMDVLLFPTVVALGALWYERTESRRDAQHEKDQRVREELAVERHTQAAALERCLDQMSYLMINRRLRTTRLGSDERGLAEARTLAILLQLGSERKRQPLKLVAQLRLIDKQEPIIKLPHADLVKADLDEVTLIEVDLTNVDLREANLTDANLSGTVLAEADLRGTSLTGAKLIEVDLTMADLRGADLTGADLTGADLTGADLTGADLMGADLTDANLRRARYD